MSIINYDHTKALVFRTGPDPFWDRVHDYLEGRPDHCWRYLAMLALRENCGWSMERIGKAFGHNKGHITRCLDKIRRELRRNLGDIVDTADPRDLAEHQQARRQRLPNVSDQQGRR